MEALFYAMDDFSDLFRSCYGWREKIMTQDPQRQHNWLDHLRGWPSILLLFLWVFILLGVFAGHEWWPTNQVFKWLWYLVWFGVYPASLVGGLIMMDRKNTKD